MPTEQNRKWGKKTITLPTGDSCDIRIITQITFLDPAERGQEIQFTILNKAGDAKRDVHVDQVVDSSGQSDGELSVERIDLWRVKDPVERGQESFTAMDNKTGGDSVPPHFTTHIKTHTTNFVSQQDSSVSITTEWIDEFIVKDPVEQYQETHYYVTGNPQNDSDSTPSGDDEDLGAESSNVRCDPYQNIVDWRGSTTFESNIYFTVHVSMSVSLDFHGGWTNPPPLQPGGLHYYDPQNPTEWPPCPAYTDWTTAHASCSLSAVIEQGIPVGAIVSGIPLGGETIKFLDNNSGVFPLDLGITLCTNNAIVAGSGSSVTGTALACSCSNPLWYVVRPLAIGVYQNVGGTLTLGSFTYDASGASITIPGQPPAKPGGKPIPPTTYTFDSVIAVGGNSGLTEASGGIIFVLKNKAAVPPKPKP